MSLVLTSPEVPAVDRFEHFDLREALLRGIRDVGFERPDKIQQRGIRPILDGRDTIVQALTRTGTGKTATYAIGVLQRIDYDCQECQALVLAPTREMAESIQKVVVSLGALLEIKCHACQSGADTRSTMDRLRDGQHCVVGLPRQVLDMISGRYLRVDKLRMFVLDEADDMLMRGCKDQIYDIFRALPANVQVCVFSATMENEIVDLTIEFMRFAVQVWEKKDDEFSWEGVQQYYVALEKEDWKLDTLCDLFECLPMQAIVYCNTRRKVDFLADQMCNRDFNSSAMHAEHDQRERDSIIREFRGGNSRYLFSTDGPGCLPDELQVSLVINYDLPQHAETYVLRVGRTGEFRRKVVAISFVTNNDVQAMKEIERHYHTQIEELPMDIADQI